MRFFHRTRTVYCYLVIATDFMVFGIISRDCVMQDAGEFHLFMNLLGRLYRIYSCSVGTPR